MPTRIKPHHDLGPCILTLESVQGIADLVAQDFPVATYEALDECWEIYDEPKDTFLDAIREREKLDSFTVEGKSVSGNVTREIQIVFSHKEATVNCVAPPDHEGWFEHFMIDLKKHILSPSSAQMMAHAYGKSRFHVGLPLLLISVLVPVGPVSSSTPYCRIVIRTKPPSPFVENIKANLVSNVIWVAIGILLTVLVQWILNVLGVRINLEWLRIP